MRKTTALYVLTAAVLMLVTASCGAVPAYDYEPVPRVESFAEGQAASGAPAEPSDSTGKTVDQVSTERLIIRNASLDILVLDTEEAVDEIEELVNELGGYVVESNLYKRERGLKAHLTLRIPAEKLDGALETIQELATEVRSKNVSGQDVTEEYVDLESRLRHLEATEERLLEFLEEAEDTEAALAVHKQLQGIQADIEQVKGRMQYLEQSAAMATVNVEITPDAMAQPIEVGGWRPQGTLRDAIERLIKVMQFLVDAAIVTVVLVIPTLIAIAAPFVGLFFLVRAIIRRRRRRKAE